MRSANKGSLDIAHLPPNPHPIPNISGPLSDPQTDFFLSALGLPHIWTRPSGIHPPSEGGEAPDIEVFVDRHGSREADPNQLSISDEEDTEEMPVTSKSKPSAASASAIDPNEIDFDDEEDWNIASETASAVRFTDLKVGGSADKRGPPGYPAGVVIKNKAPVNDVISFDDEIQISPDVRKSSFGLNLPPPKGMSLSCPVGPEIP